MAGEPAQPTNPITGQPGGGARQSSGPACMHDCPILFLLYKIFLIPLRRHVDEFISQ